MSIERNSACPCGSGKKYKKCCWLAQQSDRQFGAVEAFATRQPEYFNAGRANTGVLDRKRLISRMIDWGTTKFSENLDAAVQQMTEVFTPVEVDSVMALMDSSRDTSLAVLATDYFCHQFLHRYRGADASALRHFLEYSGPLATADREFFERLVQTHLRAYRVLSVAGDSIEVVDVIDGSMPCLRVFCMASDYKIQDKIIARLVEANGRLEFAMVLHLCVFDTKDVQDAYKGTLKTTPSYLALNSIQTGKPIRGRNREHDLAREMAQLTLANPEALAALPEHLESVQKQVLARALYALWLDDVLTHQQSAQQVPQMIFAGSGEALELHEDDYDVLDHPALLRILRAQKDVNLPDGDAPSSAMRAELVNGKIPSVGRPRSTINFDGVSKLSLFHPSKGRHQTGKAWFEKIAGDTVRFRQTRVTNPAASFSGAPNVSSMRGSAAQKQPDQAELMRNPEIHNAVVAMVKKHYATWANDQIPALSNKTPRQLMATRAGRDRVRALLLSYEQGPGGAGPAGIQIDYEFLWHELGLARTE